MTETRQVYFREVQRFRQLWIWIPLLFVAGLLWYLFIKQIIFRVPVGARPAPDAVLVLFWLLLGVGLPLLFHALKMVTEVHNDGVYVNIYKPVKIPFDTILKYEIRSYKPIREYGGWGIRYGLSGKAYNVSGNRGVQLELEKGKKLLIGSQKPEELLMAMESAMK